MSCPLLACIAGSILAAMFVQFGLLGDLQSGPLPTSLAMAGVSGFAGALIGVVLHRRFVKLGE